jgi:hypothetical protein
MTSWLTRSELKNVNRMGKRGEPCTSPMLTSRATSVQKSLNPILVKQLLIKLAIYFLAMAGIPFTQRQALRLILLTLLKAPFRSNAMSIITACLYQA